MDGIDDLYFGFQAGGKAVNIRKTLEIKAFDRLVNLPEAFLCSEMVESHRSSASACPLTERDEVIEYTAPIVPCRAWNG